MESLIYDNTRFIFEYVNKKFIVCKLKRPSGFTVTVFISCKFNKTKLQYVLKISMVEMTLFGIHIYLILKHSTLI